SALRRARRSPSTMAGSTMAVMNIPGTSSSREDGGSIGQGGEAPLLATQVRCERSGVRTGRAGSETHGARMADHDLPRARRAARADLAERRSRLLGEEIDDVAWAAPAERAEAPQKGLAGEGRLRAERERAHDVGAAADAGIHQHRGALADRAGDRRQRVD